MKLTVFGATGMVGKQVVKQALAKGFLVTAFGRNVDTFANGDLTNENLKAVKGYVFEEEDVYNALKDSEAVISAIGGAFDGQDKARSLGMKNIITQMEKAGLKKIVALGGLGILNADEHTLIIDTPGYPAQYKPVGMEHLQAWLYLKESSLDWTFVCAPDILDEKPLEKYFTNKDYPPKPNTGKITSADLANFMIAALSDETFTNSRVGISN